MELKKKLARVSKATLNIQDRGCLNFWVHVDYEEGCSQGVGGIALDNYDKLLDQRVGTRTQLVKSSTTWIRNLK